MIRKHNPWQGMTTLIDYQPRNAESWNEKKPVNTVLSYFKTKRSA